MKIALQTYSIRESMRESVVKALEQAAAMGYRYFEAANHSEGRPYDGEDVGIGFGTGPDEITALMKRLGGAIIGVHLFPFPFEEDKLDAALKYHGKIGTKYVVVPNAFYDGRDDALKMAEALERVGKRCSAEGFSLLYHNHFHEFQKFGGQTILDTLMENTSPEHVGLELDTVWAMMAGHDPVEVMKKYGKRIRMIHQKDYAAEHVENMNLLKNFRDDVDRITLETLLYVFDHGCFTEIGYGVADIQAIIETGAEVCKSEYIILEQDYTKLGEMESIKRSVESFRKYKGIEW
jgi:sugar phosphate isomerase/epimerase